MNDESKGFSWLGFAALIIILVIVSIVAFALSSIEGFLAGVVVIFIGFLLSFFRDDIKRILGLSSGKAKEPAASPTEETKSLDDLVLLNIEQKIAKGRKKLAKTKAKYDVEEKEKKKQKMEQELLEESTALIATIDQAKSYAIQQKDPDLVQHYDSIAQEVEEIRTMVSEKLAG
ncbi:MAG: hypothetical protein P1Q69_13365 [Candidatus Thorarchaeota archaeon]|nr:hypothetical protein [Candidatus Thorarchaeota archaeon]